MDPNCPTCKGVVVKTKPLIEPEEEGSVEDEEEEEEVEGEEVEEEEEEEEEEERPKRRRKKDKKDKRKIGDDENWVQPEMRDSSTWIKEYDDNYPNLPLMASAKTIAVKNQVLLWQREAPDDKIISEYIPPRHCVLRAC